MLFTFYVMNCNSFVIIATLLPPLLLQTIARQSAGARRDHEFVKFVSRCQAYEDLSLSLSLPSPLSPSLPKFCNTEMRPRISTFSRRRCNLLSLPPRGYARGWVIVWMGLKHWHGAGCRGLSRSILHGWFMPAESASILRVYRAYLA